MGGAVFVVAAAAWLVLAVGSGAQTAQAVQSVGGGAVGGAGVTGAATQASSVLSDEQTRELNHHLSIIREKKLDVAQRREAAWLLLRKDWPDAIRALAADLAPGGEPTTQQAIAQAIAGMIEPPPDALAPVLFQLLGEVDEPLLSDVAAALGRYAEHAVSRQVAAVALDGRVPAGLRRGATLTLVHYRTQEAAKTLMRLIEPNQPPAVRHSAFDALAQLTGISDYNNSYDRWQQWWDQAQKLTRAGWEAQINRNFALLNQRLADERLLLQARLTDVQSRLYRATKEEDRPALLKDMLNDPLAATRRLAIELTRQLQVDNKIVGPDLRAALLARLDDTVPALRQQAAMRLYELNDEAAAQAIAQRLAEGREHHPAVLAEYLKMMARLPQADAVGPALELLGDPELHGYAAAALAASVDKDLVQPAQAQRALTRVREQLRDDQSPAPQVITLLGRVGTDEDWQRIKGWLDSEDPAVKATAASAWADSNLSLFELAQHASDPVIQPVIIAAAARRGVDPKALSVLVQHKPAEEQAQQAWERALVAMAARVPPKDVVATDALLRARGEPGEFRLQFLSAAIDKLMSDGIVSPSTTDPPTVPASPNLPVLVDLLLARADVRLGGGDTKAAMDDYARMSAFNMPLDPQQFRRRSLGLMSGKLALGDLDGAVADAARILGPIELGPRNETTVARVAGAFLDAAKRSLEAQQRQRATQIVSSLKGLLGATVPPEVKAAIADLEARIRSPGSPTPGSPTPGSPTPGSSTPASPAPAPAGAAALKSK